MSFPSGLVMQALPYTKDGLRTIGLQCAIWGGGSQRKVAKGQVRKGRGEEKRVEEEVERQTGGE